MAIVFESPGKKQKNLLWAAITIFMLVLVGVCVLMVLPELKNQLAIIPAEGVFVMPDIKINYAILDSDQVKNLQPFGDVQTEYAYTGRDSGGATVSGKILAVSKEEAGHQLESQNITVSSMVQTNIGRSDPFSPYYQVSTKK